MTDAVHLKSHWANVDYTIYKNDEYPLRPYSWRYEWDGVVWRDPVCYVEPLDCISACVADISEKLSNGPGYCYS